MNYLFITSVLAICISITLFLVKESYTAQKRKKISFLITITSIIVTILSAVSFNFFLEEPDINVIVDNSNDNYLISQLNQGQFVTFDGLSCFILSKNFDDTKIKNSTSEFIFYNHPNNENDYNTLTFSFGLNQKYEYFSSCISMKDSINNTGMQTTIEIYAENLLIYSSADLDDTSLPFYINLSLKDISVLTFTISTSMISSNDELFRTITFSDTTIR